MPDLARRLPSRAATSSPTSSSRADRGLIDVDDFEVRLSSPIAAKSRVV
jgi:hypothetical protein